MKRKNSWISFTILALLLCLTTSDGVAQMPQSKRPNLLFIMTDQQRFDALSFAGNTVLKTPNMDRLAKEGAFFKNAHTQMAVCTPARASILTGHTVENTKMISNRVAYASEETGIMPMKTFDEILAESGYTCAYYGKWHNPTFHATVYQNPVTVAGKSKSELGPGKKAAYLEYLNPLFPPREAKENEFMGTLTMRPYTPDPIDLRYQLKKEGKPTDIKVGQSEIHGVTSVPAEYHISVFEAEGTIEAIERLKDEPFSITVSFHHPHPPYLASEEYVKMFPPEEMVVPESISDDMAASPYFKSKQQTAERYSDPEQIKYFVSEYYALVKEVDDWVGEILDKLDELELTDNTLVVFTSDHGEMLGSHGLRGKFNFYEESSHVPMMLRFPGRIKPGTVVNSPVSNMSLFATILDYLDMPEAPSDGESLRSLIENGDDKEAYIVTEWLSNLTTKPSHMVLKDGWKLMRPHATGKKVKAALYDLNTDPYEMNNLLEVDPEKYASKLSELETCFDDWSKKTGSGK
ncbi:MAG: sulfatase-like hydrolase/transferase [Cyclobacteriaceae bacterium]